MTKEKGKKKAIVAIARRLGELMYALLKKKTECDVRHLKVGRQGVEALAREAISA
jgi:hypothetical protein